MLPLVAVLLAVAVLLLSAGTLTWLYFKLIRQMSWEDHKGSYKPQKVEELTLGKPVRLLNGSTKAATTDETDAKDVEAGGEATENSGVTLLSLTPRKPEGESTHHENTTQFVQSKLVTNVDSFEHQPVPSTVADDVSKCDSASPRAQSLCVVRALTHDASRESGMKESHDKLLQPPCPGVLRCQATCLNETAANGAIRTKTGLAHHGEPGNDSEELSLSPMLWDYAGFKWPGKCREDMFTMDKEGHTDSEYSGTNDEEEDSDGHSSISGVHHGLRKTQRSYSCYSYVDHCPGQQQNHRYVQRVAPECTVLRCGAASSGSLLVSDEDEADQAFFGKAQHDESYRQYLESIILKRKARMYYGRYGHYSQS